MTTNTRNRLSKAQIDLVDESIIIACRLEHPVTVRGIFYRAMSAGAVPKTESSYNLVQRRCLLLRRAGRLPYHWVTDGTRLQLKPTSWGSVDQMLEATLTSYRRALWGDQGRRVEVWVEKDALRGVVYPATADWDVPLMIARGFASESFLWSTAQAIRAAGVPTFIFQLGDHDPSGVSAWEHTQRKLQEFAPRSEIHFERLAVNPDQIGEYNLQTRPTKESDPRARGFEGESVEVDAIAPSILRGLVSEAIQNLIDPEALRLHRIAEESEREILTRMVGYTRGGLFDEEFAD